MIYEILNEVRGENRRPDMQTVCGFGGKMKCKLKRK
jgi:hypothetical protein